MVVAVARSLGPAEFGDYLIGITAVTTVSLLATFGATTGLVRTLATHRALGRPENLPPVLLSALLPTVVVSGFAGFAIYALSSSVASVYSSGADAQGAALYITWFAGVIPLWATTTVLLCALRGLGAVFPYVACENIGRPLLQFVLTLVALLTGGGATSIAAAWMVPFIVEAFVVVVWFRTWWRRVVAPNRVRSVRTVRTQVIREYWAFTGPQAAGEAVRVVTQRMDVLLLGALSTTAAAGVYGAAMRYVAGAGMILGAITIVIGPRLSEILAIHNYPSAEQLYRRATAAGCLLGLGPYAALAFFAPLAMRIYGHAFVSGAATLSVLAAATCASLAAGPVLLVLAVAGESRLSGGIAAASGIVAVVLDLLLIPKAGALGAAISFAIALGVANLLPLAGLWRRRHLHPFGAEMRAIASAVGVSVVPCGCVWRLTGADTAKSAAGWLAAAVALYVYALWRQRRPLVRLLREPEGAPMYQTRRHH